MNATAIKESRVSKPNLPEGMPQPDEVITEDYGVCWVAYHYNLHGGLYLRILEDLAFNNSHFMKYRYQLHDPESRQYDLTDDMFKTLLKCRRS